MIVTDEDLLEGNVLARIMYKAMHLGMQHEGIVPPTFHLFITPIDATGAWNVRCETTIETVLDLGSKD